MRIAWRDAHHGTVLEREVVRELVADVLGDAVVPPKGTIVRRGSSEDDVRAEL